MRISKFLLLITFITFISLLYVYQQTEIFSLAYLGGRRQTQLADLLDKNNIFRYNINRLSSLPCLDGGILRQVDFEIPSERQFITISPTADNIKIARRQQKRTNLFLSFFTGARQAQAQTINRFPPQ
jgi:hypothetical protein